MTTHLRSFDDVPWTFIADEGEPVIISLFDERYPVDLTKPILFNGMISFKVPTKRGGFDVTFDSAHYLVTNFGMKFDLSNKVVALIAKSLGH